MALGGPPGTATPPAQVLQLPLRGGNGTPCPTLGPDVGLNRGRWGGGTRGRSGASPGSELCVGTRALARWVCMCVIVCATLRGGVRACVHPVQGGVHIHVHVELAACVSVALRACAASCACACVCTPVCTQLGRGVCVCVHACSKCAQG